MSIRRDVRWVFAVFAAASLAACQGGSFGGSPAGIPIVLESIDGAPAPVKSAFAGELATAASSRQVELVGAGTAARYRVRGYLSTEPTADGGTALAFVWDVFDAEKRRAKRLAGSSPIRTAANPWKDLDRETLGKLAAMSMDEIAGFLSESKSSFPIFTAAAGTAAPQALGFTTP